MFRRWDFRVSGFPLRGSVPHAVFRFHLPLVELDVRISRIQLSDGIRGRGPRHSHWSRMSSPSLWLVPRRPGHLVEVLGNMATLQTLAVSRTLPKSGPFPPPELPGFDGTMSLSDSPRGPACPSRASGWKPCFAARFHRLGSPVLRRSSCSDMPSSLPRWDRRRLCCSPVSSATAAFPIPLLGRLPHYLFRGLLDVHSRYGLRTRRVA